MKIKHPAKSRGSVHKRILPIVNLRASQPQECFQVPKLGNLRDVHLLPTLQVQVQSVMLATLKPREDV